jgi:hypothetical protein
MTQKDLFQTVPSSQPDTRANHSVSPGTDEARKMTAISGLKYEPLLKQSDPLGAFSRMFMVTSAWVSTKCYLIWKPLATPQGRLLFQLAVSMPPTDETGSGSSPEMWRTPDTGQGGTSGLLKQGKTHRENGQPIQVRLVDQVNNPKLWPTPLAQEAKHDTVTDWEITTDHKATKNSLRVAVAKSMWPTPTARDYKDSGENTDYQKIKEKSKLAGHAGGSLNPQWVEWLMGYPAGWTDLKD